MLAFEPPDWGVLLGLPGSAVRRGTLGGALACNLSGPRRIKAGAARDHFLGFRGVSGRGEVFKAGGKVVKNVTGYDLCKLMAGSYGTLAALEEVTIKVLPEPEVASTVLLFGLDIAAAVRSLNRALSSPHEVSAAAHIPAAPDQDTSLLSGAGAVTALRLEGPAPSVEFRCQKLLTEFASDGEAAAVEGEASTRLWRAVRDLAPLADLDDRVIWRISAPPSRGAELVETITRSLDASWYLDWGGALLWVAVPVPRMAGLQPFVPRSVEQDGRGSGHATLIKGSPALRRSIPVFEPQPPALAALAARVKEGFDPRRILNPGRMVEEG